MSGPNGEGPIFDALTGELICVSCDKPDSLCDCVEPWQLYRDMTATLQSWVDSVNAKPLRCSCTSPLSGCRCDRPVTADDGLCNYCRASCSRPRPRSLPAGRGETAALTPTVGRDRQEEDQ